MKILSKILPLGGLWGLILSCTSPSIPTDATHTDKLPDIYPDYTGVTIPANLCPTNFMLPDCEGKNGRNCVLLLPEARLA